MPWLYNCAFPVETMEEQNGLGFVSPIGWFEPTHNAIKTICRESKCKSRAELAKLAWAIMPRCSFAYSKKKRWVLCVSNQLQSVILVSFFSLCLKRENQKIIVVYANFTIVLFANSGNVVTFAPKLYIYDREH